MDFLQPLIIGLLGSFHCMGMCGPIALSLPLKERSWGTRIISGVLYNLGRVLTYVFLGLIFGLMGLGIHIWGIQQWVSIGVGALMILSVAFPILFHGSKLTGGIDNLFSGFKKYFGRFFGFRTYLSIWIIGLLNGLLPCGLVYIALAGALVSSSPFNGALYMMIFGLGTIPALLALSMLGNVISMAFRRRMQQLIPFMIILIGILFVLRGMNLGIPYLSPKMDQTQKQKTEQLQKPKCCH
ncbi:MAG: sulfite exporter TauE/SafE family protein [Bacteroidetes bacterium]|nr:sulfite exporter TauE/SafE family protein [Bacteroidota bacterium]